MALTSVRSNKMRSLLTMLGIIIGIAAVIAIETVGNSMTGSVMDSMSGMGASNISVTVTQKSSSDTSGTSQGVQLRRFMDSKPSDADLITDAMINDFTAAFPTQVHHIELTQQVGSGTTAKYGDPATVSGINHAALAARNDDSQILYGRWLDDDRDAGRKVACVSEKFVEQAIGGSAQDAIGKAVTLTINQNLYTFYIQGVYKYTEDSYSSMFGGSDDDSIQTDFYIPLDVAKAIAGAPADQQLRVLKRCIKKGLSVRQVEELVRSLSEAPGKEAQNVEDEEYPESYLKLVEQLEKFFSQEISIKRAKNGGGKIVIGFTDDRDIEQFIERFAKRS